MEVYEGTLKLFLLKDIFNKNYQEKIAAIIDKSFLVSDDKKLFHKERKLKGYVFNGFFDKNTNKNKDFKYPSGSVYSVRIRSLDKDLMEFFKCHLGKTRTEEIQGLTFEYRVLPNTIVKKLYSITPAVCKFEDGYWKNSHSLEDVIIRIEQNARKKLAMLNEEVPDNIDFIINSKKLNNYPIIREFNHKSPNSNNQKIKFLCDKFEFEISPNEGSQKLAKAIIGAGLLEMNARGFGYVNVKTV